MNELIKKAKLNDEEKSIFIQCCNELEQVDPKFVLRGCFHKKFDLKKSKESVLKYMEWRKTYDLDNLNIDKVRQVMAKGYHVYPEMRDKENRTIIAFIPRKIPQQEFTTLEMFQAWCCMIEHILKDHHTCREGVTLIGNFKGMKLGHFNMDIQRKIQDSVQDCVPLRLRRIILLNTGWVFTTIFRILSPFLKKKMKQRIRLVNSEQLKEHVNIETLPKQLGGNVKWDIKEWSKTAFA